MSKQAKTILFIIVAVIAAALIFYFSGVLKKAPQPSQGPSTSENSSPATSTEPSANQNPGSPAPTSSAAQLTPSIANWYITPQNSPVQPERFTGYHTGVDFETFSDEQNIDVPIYAICSGPLLTKRTATGYGGIAVQACKLNDEDITVIYGHLRLASISSGIGQELKAGDKLAVLGAGFSQETDGERKHLHLGIHKGTAINILGYVQNPAELQNWIDIIKYLK